MKPLISFAKKRSGRKYHLKNGDFWFRVIAKQTDSAYDTLSFEDYKEKYIFPFVSEDYLEAMRHFLHRKYLAKQLNTANSKLRTEFLFIHDTQLLWTSCEVYKLELNKAQDTYPLLLNDIDTKKRQELELRESAERDGLTEQLYFQADHALYQVKETQKNGWKVQP